MSVRIWKFECVSYDHMCKYMCVNTGVWAGESYGSVNVWMWAFGWTSLCMRVCVCVCVCVCDKCMQICQGQMSVNHSEGVKPSFSPGTCRRPQAGSLKSHWADIHLLDPKAPGPPAPPPLTVLGSQALVSWLWLHPPPLSGRSLKFVAHLCLQACYLERQ